MSRFIPQHWLFHQLITGQDSWAELFQSIKAFSPLIEEIFSKNHLTMGEVHNLTPGTNAVFRINNTVVKIFAPYESGFNTNNDYFIELSALQHANEAGVASPVLVCSGEIEDRYLFRYIVMGFINGQEAGDCLDGYTKAQKISFARKLKTITVSLNVKCKQIEIPKLCPSDCLENKSWDAFPRSFCDDRTVFLSGMNYPEPVYTHGDLTGENIIVDGNNDIYVIDFADSRIAPYYYEWPPIVFGLFGCNQTMMQVYFGDFHSDEFYDQLIRGVVIHDLAPLFYDRFAACPAYRWRPLLIFPY